MLKYLSSKYDSLDQGWKNTLMIAPLSLLIFGGAVAGIFLAKIFSAMVVTTNFNFVVLAGFGGFMLGMLAGIAAAGLLIGLVLGARKAYQAYSANQAVHVPSAASELKPRSVADMNIAAPSLTVLPVVSSGAASELPVADSSEAAPLMGLTN